MPKNPPKPIFTPAKNPLQTPNQQETLMIFMPMNPNPPKIVKKDQKNGKCFVYFFTLFVILCLVALVFASLVLRVKNPTLRIDSLSIKSLKFDYSPSFNITLFLKISISNRNFGHFEFDDEQRYNSVSLGYGNMSTVVGHSKLKFKSGRVESRGEQNVGIDMKVSSSSKPENRTRVYKDLSSGVLEFVGFAKVKGKVHLLKKLRLSSVAYMNCTFQIDLGHIAVQKLQC